LTVHLGGSFLPPAVRGIVGDALWAMMIVCVAAPAVCVGLELSTRPWLDALRRTLPGHLVFGSGSDPYSRLSRGSCGVARRVRLTTRRHTGRRSADLRPRRL
jgi:hypothetical protein